VGGIIGAALAILFRMRTGAGVLPTGLAPFAAVAAAIGGVEEVLYRGYVQGRLRLAGRIAAVALTAAVHTAYKSALFVWPLEGVAINFTFLIAATFLGGLTFGALRELSGNVWPPLAAHVVFDLAVYGDWSQAPWWVWT
jgi:membrane protease YdiL (CAAX protease family)